MTLGSRATAALAAVLLVSSSCGGKSGAESDAMKESVEVRTGVDHGAWSRLLAKYVNGRGEVDYAAWRDTPKDRESLTRYLGEFSGQPEPAAKDGERIASLGNAYNAFTIDWILRNYPTASIRSLKHSFTGARNSIGGRKVSLDDIEHATLRPIAGYRVHSILSCASRSCPPLARKAFEARSIEEQLNERMAVWLGREDLNRFLSDQKKVEISEVFQWFLEDFQKAGGLRKILARHAHARYRDFLSGGRYAIGYLTYDWGLNDQGKEGRHYGRLHLFLDTTRDRLR